MRKSVFINKLNINEHVYLSFEQTNLFHYLQMRSNVVKILDSKINNSLIFMWFLRHTIKNHFNESSNIIKKILKIYDFQLFMGHIIYSFIFFSFIDFANLFSPWWSSVFSNASILLFFFLLSMLFQ